jgi:hypothetical protein
MKSSTALNGGPTSWEEVGNEFADDKWYYQPWSGIGETEFYPQSHAGNRMFFFPSPTETVGAEQEAAAPPPPEKAAPMPDISVAASEEAAKV